MKQVSFISEAQFPASSSILWTVPRVLRFWALPLWLAMAPLTVALRPQDPTEKKTDEPKPDTFFTGNLIESTVERITVSRKALGKTEKRVFRLTPDTKCEGELKVKALVTVRYVTTEEGDAAVSIIVRPVQKKK
jgi:hypothetical protein